MKVFSSPNEVCVCITFLHLSNIRKGSVKYLMSEDDHSVCTWCLYGKKYRGSSVSHTNPSFIQFQSVKLGRRTARKEDVWGLLTVII